MRKLLVSLFIVCVAAGCRKDFIVEDISRKSIVVNAPANGTKTVSNVITFWWEPLVGAEYYTLQVVKPDFKNIAMLVLDTNTQDSKVTINLTPGTYQWRVKGVNAGHSTKFQTFDLIVDTTSNLGELFVTMLSPTNGELLGNGTITFAWSSLSAAKRYNIQVNNGIVLDTIVTKSPLTVVLPTVAENVTSYSWNVKALNDQSETQFNPSAFTFTIDLKSPTAPVITSPVSGAVVKDTTTLRWVRASIADIAFDSVYVASDSIFTSVLGQTSVDGTSIRIMDLEASPLPKNQFYWWCVRSFDNVGNRSNSSTRLKFFLAP